jgi:hypothetical protein
LDAEIAVTQSEDEEESCAKRRGSAYLRRMMLLSVGLLAIERWVTGDRAEQPEQEIDREILDEELCLMHSPD